MNAELSLLDLTATMQSGIHIGVLLMVPKVLTGI